MTVSPARPNEDRWVPTTCYMCYSHCSVRARLFNGTVVDIAGDPESPHSKGKVCAKGRAKPTEMVHPEVVAIAGAFGNWAKGMPVARGQGVHFNTLLPAGMDRVDKLCAGLDCCAKVKVYKT